MKKFSALTEKDVLKQLDIPNFRFLTKDKVMAFANMLPYMDKETAQKALEQFPNFANVTKELIEDFCGFAKEACLSNDSSMQNYYSLVKEISSSLLIRLDKPDLSTDERREILGALLSLERNASSKDTENKKFILGLVFGVGSVVLAGLGLLAAALGSNIRVQTKTTA